MILSKPNLKMIESLTLFRIWHIKGQKMLTLLKEHGQDKRIWIYPQVHKENTRTILKSTLYIFLWKSECACVCRCFVSHQHRWSAWWWWSGIDTLFWLFDGIKPKKLSSILLNTPLSGTKKRDNRQTSLKKLISLYFVTSTQYSWNWEQIDWYRKHDKPVPIT